MSIDPHDSGRPRLFSGRRLILLASVAGLGAFLAFAGPAYYAAPGVGLGTPAQAADAALPHPAGFADLVAKVKPAVISVRVKITGAAQPAAMREGEEVVPFAPGSPMEKFFQQFGQPGQDGQRLMPQPRQTVIGEGSGFFISPDGYAVTNNHVVDHASSVQVTTDDGKIYTARVIGTDPKTDLALIKVDGKSNFPYVKFADHAPKVGDWVVAVGNPFGLGGTVTAGIVSANGRDIGSGYGDYIQIDAPINKGNSGGPAFDVDGNVIGINTAIYSPSGGSVGIGFDIPADIAKDVVAQLKTTGHVSHGWLGVQIQPVTADIADSLGLKNAQGAIVDAAQPGSPAARAGLEAGDVIVAVNGNPVKNANDIARTIAMLAPDTAVKLDIMRQGQTKTVTATLANMPNEQQQASARTGADHPASGVPHLGLTVAPASAVPGAGSTGVVVTGVEPNGPAAEHGFQAGNVILDIAGKQVSSANDVVKALHAAKAQGRHDVLMRVKSGDSVRFVALPLGDA